MPLVAAVIGAASVAGARAGSFPRPCSLVTRAEASRILGAPVRLEPGEPASCNVFYGRQQGFLDLHSDSQQKTLLRQYRRRSGWDITRKRGVGSVAYQVKRGDSMSVSRQVWAKRNGWWVDIEFDQDLCNWKIGLAGPICIPKIGPTPTYSQLWALARAAIKRL
jgi:hypothetical protein